MVCPYEEQILNILWSEVELKQSDVWVILDGARDDRIFPALKNSKLEYLSLYQGRLPRELQWAVPYMVQLDPNYSFTGPLLEQCWGNSWGIFLKIKDSTGLRHHLRKFLRVKDETGKKFLFRYYDPRVMRVYLPTCNIIELQQVFGPIQQYIMEGKKPETLIEFSFTGLRLKQRKISLASKT